MVNQLLPLRKQIVMEMEVAYNYQVSTITSQGALGNLCNWQKHIADLIIEKPGEELEALLGEKLSAEYLPGRKFTGSSRLIVPTVRTNLNKGEDLTLKVLCIGLQPAELMIKWRNLGEKSFRIKAAGHIARGVYEIVIPASEIRDDFEYFISCTDKSGKRIL